eukprot:CAMPEP_0201589864 /NCGR_PEP_ID=MMETSP0190_2-20130828/171625_1 /ASSEMBLY_ACC=CAM_ASM_000263 /TAXON_ID=37353 /ORGANISM="Rosalina sp." /LENGTH=96 /DNA_ID=CAMNT_0048044905 /DNA_START=223 /DNA_END=510 /DNA_ORIENTATION=-
MQPSGYAMSDEDEDEGVGNYGAQRKGGMRAHAPGSIGSFGSFNNKKYDKSKPYKQYGAYGGDGNNMGKRDQLMALPNHFYNPQRSQLSDRGGGGGK